MRVVYEESILAKIAKALHHSKVNDLIIKEIIVTKDEWSQLNKFVQIGGPLGAYLGGCGETYPTLQHECQVFGIRVVRKDA